MKRKQALKKEVHQILWELFSYIEVLHSAQATSPVHTICGGVVLPFGLTNAGTLYVITVPFVHFFSTENKVFLKELYEV